MKKVFTGKLIIAGAFFLSPFSSLAFEEPTVNLGASSFFDGMASINGSNAESGFYFNEYLQWYSADRFNDDHGNALPGAPKLNVYTSLNQLIYLADKPHFLGARLGIDALIPVVSINPSPKNTPFNANGGVLGDLTIGPAIQFDPIMHGTNPMFMHRIDLDVIVPTGSYNRNDALNPGANFLSVNPYWAGTLFLGSDLVMSWRIHYLWNDVNSNPESIYSFTHPGTTSVQAGQAVHLNFDAAYNLYAHHLYGGINGYYFKQITESKFNGVSIAGTEERVLGIGPGIAYIFNKNFEFFLNGYFETAVANRPSGTRLNAVFALHF